MSVSAMILTTAVGIPFQKLHEFQ